MPGHHPCAEMLCCNVPILGAGRGKEASFEACVLPAKLVEAYSCNPGSWEMCFLWVCSRFVAQVTAACSM